MLPYIYIADLKYSRNVFAGRWSLGQSRTPVPTIDWNVYKLTYGIVRGVSLQEGAASGSPTIN